MTAFLDPEPIKGLHYCTNIDAYALKIHLFAIFFISGRCSIFGAPAT
jgi:hypothetical protein